ncbi:MAG: hypothetical protein KBA26_11095 [Candidatus Delongbacteria bacterium]|nr:hypothetical protein [Candidatus Delongbacteria bacterium]
MDAKLIDMMRTECSILQNGLGEWIRSESITDWPTYLKTVIMSSSGFRKVFAWDRNQDSLEAAVTHYDIWLTYCSVCAFVRYLNENHLIRSGRIAVGRDTRPTGSILAAIVNLALLEFQIKPVYLGISASPEIMAMSTHFPGLDGFFYLTASHNPPGFNGFKFGCLDGVLDGEQVKEVIQYFHESAAELPHPAWFNLWWKEDLDHLQSIYRDIPFYKATALDSYARFLQIVFWGPHASAATIQGFISNLIESPITIIGELNGSSRIMSVDEQLMHQLGIIPQMENTRPGVFSHPIVPEGESLEEASRLLQRANQDHFRAPLAYVPDCDGDRGNLVIWDPIKTCSVILPAQIVFLLSALAEIGYAFMSGQMTHETSNAVIVNDCTSHRLDEMLSVFPIRIFRVETGEANIINKARMLEHQGWRIRIMGEGSNGGNITRPSNTRDPLSSVISFLKLLYFRSQSQSIYDYLLAQQPEPENQGSRLQPTLMDYLSLIPGYITTSAFEIRSILTVHSSDQIALKQRFETLFVEAWVKIKSRLKKKYGIVNYREQNFEGVEQRTGFGPAFRTGDHSGGLKIEWLDASGQCVGWIFFRKSKTENLVRTLVEMKNGREEDEIEMREWLQSLVGQADSQ